MSITVGNQSLPIMKCLDSRLELGLPRMYNAVMGCKDNICYQQAAQSFSVNAYNWSFTVPSITNVVNRKIYVKPYIHLTVAGGAPLRSGVDGLRQVPLSAVTSNINVQYNGSSTSIEPQEIIHALLSVGGTQELRNHYYSVFPGWADQFQTVVEFSGTLARNANGVYGQTLENTRSWQNYLDPDVPSTATDYYLTWAEPVFISPMLWSERNGVGLTQLQTLEVKYTLSPPLNRLFELSPSPVPGPIPTISNIVNTRAPELLLQVFSLHVEEVPRTVNWPWYSITRYPQSAVTVPAGGTAVVTTNTITMSSIPHRAFVYAKRSLNTQSEYSTDTFAVPQQVSVTYKAHSGILNEFNQQQLYQMCVNNGLDQLWPQFSNHTGAPLVMEFGTDIPLDLGEASGLQGKFNLQVRYTFKNPTASSVEYTPYLMTCEEGVLCAENSNFRTYTGPINSIADVMAAEHAHGAYESIHPSMYGGSWSSFWNKTKNIVGKIASVVRSVAPVVGRVASAVGDVVPHPAVRGIAQGIATAANVANKVAGGRRHRRRSVSRGGRVMSRSQLARRSRR